MGEFRDLIRNLSVRTMSPDRGIHVEFRGDDQFDVRFSPEAYRAYREHTLVRQLDQVGALTWAGYRREYLRVLDVFVGGLVDMEITDDRERDFWQRLEHLQVVGMSPGRQIRVRSRALVSWAFEIAPDALRFLTERDFLVELHGVATAALTDYRSKVAQLTDEIYHPELVRLGSRGRGF